MSEIAAQASFNSGEWSPALYARVDLQKYRSGAALLENFFVDYRGGASTRPGTAYVIQTYKSSTAVRLIRFQASFDVGYILELGNQYIRFIYNGSPILETATTISGATNADPCVLTDDAHGYSVGDWIWIDNIVGMTQLNGRYFSVLATTTNTITLGDLNGNDLDSTDYGTYSSGGTAQRIYTIASPWAASDLALVKFAQSVNEMVLVHPNYPPQLLTLTSPTDWSIAPVTIGTPIGSPTNVAVATTLSSGNVNYGYAVTAIDANGNESAPTYAQLSSYEDMASVAGTNHISWDTVTGAVAYNVYKANVSYYGVVPDSTQYGFIGTTTGESFDDTNIGPDYSESPPVVQNPIAQGSEVISISVVEPGSYAGKAVPTVSFSGGDGSGAAASATLALTSISILNGGELGEPYGNPIGQVWPGPGNTSFLVAATELVEGGLFWAVTELTILDTGELASGTAPSSYTFPWTWTVQPEISMAWGVSEVVLEDNGSGYTSAPTVAFDPSGATATANIGSATTGYPSAVGFFQERMVLAAPPGAPQTFYMSQPGSYFNFNTSQIVAANDAITGTLVAGILNTIKSIVSSTSGMLLLTDQASWVTNGGSSGAAITPTSILANAQSYIGANDVPPIVANYDVLYVQSKGAQIRDLAYNIYFNVFTGTDISLIASHLFYGYQILEWAWAEQPFYVVWAIRNDGVMLTLTFLKDQDFCGWSHQITNGNFMSVASVTETTTDGAGIVDAVYTVVQRIVNGNVVQYIERVADRVFQAGLSSAWCVDCGFQFIGSPETSFQGAEALAGLTVTGLATDSYNNVTIITPFTMPVNGEFTLPNPPSGAPGYTTVTVGLAFTASLQTLALEVGQPTIQGKVKKIANVDVRVNDTLGLTIGPDFDHLVPMQDLIPGNVSSMLTGQESQTVEGLYSGDARTYLGPAYTVPGQYCIQQSNPYPATVLGVFPAVAMGDVGGRP